MRLILCGLACVLACVEPVALEPTQAAAPAPVSAPTPDGDPLLGEARRSIAQGVMAPGPKAALLASTRPEHTRARALLGVLEPPEPAPPTAAPVVDPPTQAPEITASPVVAPGPITPPPVAAARTRPTLEKLAMRTTKAGASLTIHANSGVLVGVANQPGAGVVRLVLEDVAAAAKVLSARPEVPGARVRDVSVGPKSVRITLQLEPGWRFGGVHRTATGARVDLIGP